MALNQKARRAIADLVNAVVTGDFAYLSQDGRLGRLGRDGLESAIREYGRTLVPTPADAIEHLESYRSADDPARTAVDVPLWTREEGKSDLTLSLTVIDDGETIKVSIDDLHVL